MAAWEALGITRISGRPFPEAERDQDVSLLLPAGRFGPAFLVTPNFYVLKDYNRSDLYALFVGNAGDRIEWGVGAFRAGWGDIATMYRSDIKTIQTALEGKGHDVGGADGLPGYKTRRSIGQWQAGNGTPETCFPSTALLGQITR